VTDRSTDHATPSVAIGRVFLVLRYGLTVLRVRLRWVTVRYSIPVCYADAISASYPQRDGNKHGPMGGGTGIGWKGNCRSYGHASRSVRCIQAQWPMKGDKHPGLHYTPEYACMVYYLRTTLAVQVEKSAWCVCVCVCVCVHLSSV